MMQSGGWLLRAFIHENGMDEKARPPGAQGAPSVLPPPDKTVLEPLNTDVQSDVPTDRAAALIDTAPEPTRAVRHGEGEHHDRAPFVPMVPKSLRDARISGQLVEDLVVKLLLNVGAATAQVISRCLCLPASWINQLLERLKTETLVTYRGASTPGQLEFLLTPNGTEQALRLSTRGTYYGAVPVTLDEYRNAVKQQSLKSTHVTPEAMQRSLGELEIDGITVRRLGQAAASCASIFLFGAPGNGKTSIAERMIRVFGTEIWMPRAICCDGEIIRLFDPLVHEELPFPMEDQETIDRRWVRIKRPSIVVGGELTMSNLELTPNVSMGVIEATMQMKSNCGALVIDDFGRQRMRPDELLNRWIVPLEKKYDLLDLPSGKRIEVPFEQLLIFSTNLDPTQLVDEAFMRRIPYKVHVKDPTESQFRQVFVEVAKQRQVQMKEGLVDYLIDTHYRKVGRPFRFCHARDLIAQVTHQCTYEGTEFFADEDRIDLAADNYFPEVKPDWLGKTCTTS